MQRIIQRYRYSAILLRQLVKTDFKLRYQGSMLGYAWSLLRPLFMFAILYVVFTKFLRVGAGVPHYPVYLLLGIVLWNYFVEITSGSVAAVVSQGDLIRKLNFPKYIIVLSTCASAVINLLLNGIVIAVFMMFSGVDIRADAWLVLFLFIELTIFAVGVGFLLSALYVRYRDISYIWEVIVQAAFYATPILYPLAIVPLLAQKYLLLNPVAQIIQDTRHLLVTPDAVVIGDIWNRAVWLVPIVSALSVAAIGMFYFRKRSRYFAEEV